MRIVEASFGIASAIFGGVREVVGKVVGIVEGRLTVMVLAL